MAKEATDSSGPPTDRLTEPRAPQRRCRDVKTARGLEICDKPAGEVPARKKEQFALGALESVPKSSQRPNSNVWAALRPKMLQMLLLAPKLILGA
jgi:hypothetical protein